MSAEVPTSPIIVTADPPPDAPNVLAATPADRASQRGYHIAVAQGDLNFRPLVLDDPVPLGRQILARAGATPVDEFSLVAILPTGEFEDLRLDEPYDLRAQGTERFVAFRTDRLFKFTLDGRGVVWGTSSLSAAVLYTLAAVVEGQAVFLDTRGGTDRLITPDETLDLSAPGVERFITAAMPPAAYEIVINGRARVVSGRVVTFEQVVQLAFPNEQADPNVVFSMTYRHAASQPSAGELGPQGSVEVKTGTVFNVTKTVQS